jgi:hypothetical protein
LWLGTESFKGEVELTRQFQAVAFVWGYDTSGKESDLVWWKKEWGKEEMDKVREVVVWWQWGCFGRKTFSSQNSTNHCIFALPAMSE